MLIIVHKHVVPILPNISHKHIIVGKAISALRLKSKPPKILRDLPVVRACIRPHGLLTKYKPCLMKILCNAKELKTTIREENVMDNMLE